MTVMDREDGLKRALDMTLAGGGLLVLSPVIVALLIAIRIDSPGNPLFAQTRVGRYGRTFVCYKLRTMRTGSANVLTHLSSTSALTRLGGFLRASKLDELPQLYNVLVGEMSLVGPRPGLPSDRALYQARERQGVLALRPGITGLAQLQGFDMSNSETLAAADARYLERRSVGLDLWLILATVLRWKVAS